MGEPTNLELLGELGVDLEPEKKATRTAEEERIIAGFEDIQKFVNEHGHLPRPGEHHDIFERLYAIRLDRIRGNDRYRDLVCDTDDQGLLSAEGVVQEGEEEYKTNAELLADLGLDSDLGGKSEVDVTQLRHVKPRTHVRANERSVSEVANRSACEDFAEFEALFKQVKTDLDQGVRKTIRFGKDASIGQGNLFILDGLLAYVATIGAAIQAPNGEKDARLRVVFSNATQSDMLMRSLKRALYKDETGRRITDRDWGPIFNYEQKGQ